MQTGNGVTDVLGTGILVALGSAVTILSQLYREKQNREDIVRREKQNRAWEIEDRDRRAADANDAGHKRIATVIAKIDETITKVDENTAVNVEALKEANNVNAKLVGIGLQRLEREKEADRRGKDGRDGRDGAKGQDGKDGRDAWQA